MASALFSFIDSIGETFEGVVENVETVVGSVEKEVDSAMQQIDAGVDLDDVLEEIQLAGTDEAALLLAYKKLEVLAQNQTAAILHGWVVEDRVVPVVCAALCRVESARLAAGPLARTLNGMGQALDLTGTTPEELRAFHEQIVRRTENGKAMLKLLQAQDLASRTQGFVLLRRVYPETSAVLGRHLLSDPESISALTQILQAAKASTWEAERSAEIVLCAECVRFLRLVTANDGDVRMIVTFQDGAEALLSIAARALSARVPAADLAVDACVCVKQLVGQGPVAQKYMREAGHLLTLTRTLHSVFAALGLSEANEWTSGLRNVATTLLECLATFVAKASNEAADNSKAIVQSGLVDLVCQEVLPYPRLDPLRLQAVEVLAGAAKVVPTVAFLQAPLQSGTVLDLLVAALLEANVSELRTGLEGLLMTSIERSQDVRQALVHMFQEDSTGGLLRALTEISAKSVEPSNTWFSARLLGHCLRCEPELRGQLARPESGASLSSLLGPTTALARAWRSEAHAEMCLCALLQLLAEWCHGCPAAAEVISSSPAQLPELMALLESSTTAATTHVRGLAALVLGTCLLELPEAGLVGASRLMDIIASRGVETFTRAAEDFQRCLDKPANAQRYHGGFHAWASSQFQKVQDAMVRIWLEQGERERPAQGMAEDVAGHFKDLIKMQDKELRDLRAEVQQLKSENHELRKLTTDEDKTLLLWKVGALTKQCEALQVQCDLLQASRSSVEVARLRERQALREQRQELEQQLQVLALALDEADLATAKEPSEEPSQASQCQIIEMDERDELLAVLSQIHRSCPEAAAFLAPLGRFAAPEVKVSAWEDAADRLGRQAEAVSVLAASHGQRVSELKEQQEQRKQHEGQHQGYSHANKGSPHGSDSAPWKLPEGWMAYATAEGHVFYHNQSTGHSQWEPPR